MRVSVPAACLLCVLAVAVHAQEQHGAIYGLVLDPAGAAAAGARVAVRRSGGFSVATTADKTGRYRFASLPPGRYTVEASATGFRATHPAEVLLLLGQALEINPQLGPPGITETVEVAGRAPSIDLRQNGVAMSIRDELIHELPRGRDYSSLVTQAGGVNAERKLAGLSVDGSSGAENRYVIDGVDTTNPLDGTQGKLVPPELVEEVQVKYGGYAAEHGGSTGGVINVVTRGGTNTWRGEVGAVYSSDALGVALDAPGETQFTDGRPTLRISPIDNNRAEYVTYPGDEFVRWQPSLVLGGPLVKDRAWLFAAYMPQLTRRARTVTFRADRTTRRFTRSVREHFLTANLLAGLGAGTRLRVAANVAPLTQMGGLPAPAGTGNPAVDFAVLGHQHPNTAVSAALDHAAANRIQLSVRAGLFRLDYRDLGVPDEPRVRFVTSNVGMTGVPAELQRPRSFQTVPTNYAVTRDLQRRAFLHTDGTWYGSLAGEHAVKLGLQLERSSTEVLEGTLQPVVSLLWGQPITTTDGRRVRGVLGTYTVARERISGDVSSHNLGVFLQDAWTIGRRLTLNLGVRSEREAVPSYAEDPGVPRTAIEFSFRDKLAPRLGFALDAAGDGRWKVHGSWGVYYDVFKSLMPRYNLGGSRYTEYYFTLDDADWTRLPPPGCPPACPGTLIETFDYVLLLNDPANQGIDPGLRPMRQQEWVIGVERALAPHTSLSVRYVHKKLDRTVEDVGVFVPGLGRRFYVANPGFGLARTTLPVQCAGPCPDQPGARRDYRGFAVDLRRRMTKRFGFHAAYHWSELRGNYAGLADSDEDTGIASPNWQRTFDALVMSFDQFGRPAVGPLATDRPHQIKLDGGVQLPFGTALGARWSAASGIPINRRVLVQSGSFPVHHLGRGNGGRTPALSQLDLHVRHEFGLGGRWRLQVAANALNVLDQRTATSAYSLATQNNIVISDAEFFRGFDAERLMVEQGTLRDPRFLLAHRFQEPRSVWMSVKLLF